MFNYFAEEKDLINVFVNLFCSYNNTVLTSTNKSNNFRVEKSHIGGSLGNTTCIRKR